MAMQTFTKDGGEHFVVLDLTQDPQFHSHASVTGPPHNRFYVSVPIMSPDDYVIGSIAVLDDKPRVALTEEQIQV
jgi:GAF domain-containing protein